jgi:hypothetical protein
MAEPNEPIRSDHDALLADRLAVPGGMRPRIWHLAAPGRSGVLSAQLAHRLLDTHTTPGGVVIDVDDDTAFAAASIGTGRRHHALGGDTRLAALGHVAGQVHLVLLHWPRPQANPRWLLVACRALLHPDGRLVVAVAVPAAYRAPHLSALSGAARAAGLHQVEHIAVVDAAGPPDRRRHDTRRAAAGCIDDTTGDDAGRSTSADVTQPYLDLLVFKPTAGSHG